MTGFMLVATNWILANPATDKGRCRIQDAQRAPMSAARKTENFGVLSKIMGKMTGTCRLD
jgi:hypothetical protein